MSWRDRLTARGSFRGVEFWVDADGHDFAPRTVVHQYPNRDEPYVESNGKGAVKYSVSAIVIGQNYDEQRDKLISALATPGPGELRHPFYGTFQANVIKASKRESTKSGGKAVFDITFVKSGNIRYPTTTNNTQDDIDKAVSEVQAAAIDDFGESFNVLGQAQEAIDTLTDELNNALAEVEKAIGNVTGPIAEMIRAPADMGAAIMGSIGRIKRQVLNPINALNIYKDMFFSGLNRLPLPQVTPGQQQQVKNLQALDRLIQRAAMVGAGSVVATINFKTTNHALNTAGEMTGAINAHIAAVDQLDGGVIDDAVYNALIDLRGSVTTDLHQRAAQLPRLIDYTLPGTLPAIVLAHKLYGDANRDQEINDKNSIQHPGFLPAGKLQVLNK